MSFGCSQLNELCSQSFQRQRHMCTLVNLMKMNNENANYTGSSKKCNSYVQGFIRNC